MHAIEHPQREVEFLSERWQILKPLANQHTPA
jgi:hypothetical protein